jgi:hypothetical protein
MDAWAVDINEGRKEKTASQEATVANPEKMGQNPEIMQCAGEHGEVPKEELLMKSSRTMKKRHRGRHLAAGRRREPKELTRGGFGSRKMLAATCRKMACRGAVVAGHKRSVFRKIGTQGNN